MRTNAIFYLTLALCAGVVSACVDENINSDKDVNGKAIKFGLSSQKTKTVYDDTDPYQINWVNGDQITIFCAEAESAKSALYNVTPASTAKDGIITNAGSDVLQWGGDGLKHYFYAVYPGSTAKVDENGIATFSINRNQKCTVETTNGYENNVVAKPDMKNANMVAYKATEPTDGTVSLSFKPLMTTLEIVVTGPKTNINSSYARVTGVSIVSTITTTSSESGDSFKYDIKKGLITGSVSNVAATTKKSETTFISLVDANGNASYVDLANSKTLTLTAFLPPMSEAQAAAMKRQVKVRVHITGNAELSASIKTNDAGSDNWTTQFKPAAKKKITLLAIPSGDQQTGNNWITPLDGNIYVSQMSIPGSHDAATGEKMATFVGEIFAQTQEQTLQAQWNLGVRAFDLRPALYDKNEVVLFGRKDYELWLYHGMTRVAISWATAMKTIKANLTSHPGEFAIVLFRHEDESTAFKNTNTTDFDNYMKAWVNENKAWIVNWRPDITIDECRGKLILISRFEGSWDYGCFTGWSHDAAGATTTVRKASSPVAGTMYVQDYYDASSHETKFNSIKNYLDIAQKFHTEDALKNHWMLNHVSGYVGYSTSNTYRANAAAQNPKVIEYLHNRTTPGSTGIILFDYSGAATSGSYTVQGDVMLQTVIDNNYKYRMRRKGE